jgi:hypothetical protein
MPAAAPKKIAAPVPPLRYWTRIKLQIIEGVGTVKNVKRWHYMVLAGLGLLGILYVYLHRQELGLVGPRDSAGTSRGLDSPSLSSRPPRIAWQTVNREKNGFRVDMPSDIKEIQVPAYSESGGIDQVNMIFSNPSSDITFSVAWADNPPVVRTNGRSPDRTLDMARDEALARTQTTLVNEARITPGGFPAREILAHNVGGGVMDCRLILAGERLYMLTAVFPSSNARREQDVLRFFNSFSAGSSKKVPESLPAAEAPTS